MVETGSPENRCDAGRSRTALIPLADRTWLIVGRNEPFAFLPGCNSLLIRDEICALVDTCAGEDLRPLAGEPAGAGRDEDGGGGAGGTAVASAVAPLAGPIPVDLIIHTHVHPDHVNYDFLFPAARVWTPDASGDALTSVEAFVRFTGVSALGAEVARYVAREVGFRPRAVDRTYGDGEALDFGRTKLRALHAPGHSPDHMILVDEESGTVFATDIDLTPFGPWYGNPGSDIDQTLASIDKVIALRPRRLVTSHSPHVWTEGIAERLRRYAAIVGKRDERILALLGEPRTAAEIAAAHPMYRSYPHPREVAELWERNMVTKHLDRLVRAGRLRREDDGRYRRD